MKMNVQEMFLDLQEYWGSLNISGRISESTLSAFVFFWMENAVWNHHKIWNQQNKYVVNILMPVWKGGQAEGRSPMALCPPPSGSAGRQAGVSCSAEQGQGSNWK